MNFVAKFVKKRKGGTKRTFKNLLGRKSTIKERKNLYISPGLHGLLKRHAKAKGVYLEELAESFLRDSLMRAEGWERPDDSGAESRKARQIIDENATMRLCEEILKEGCPPDEISISAEIHPNLREWAEDRGIRYVEGLQTSVHYPREYGHK